MERGWRADRRRGGGRRERGEYETTVYRFYMGYSTTQTRTSDGAVRLVVFVDRSRETPARGLLRRESFCRNSFAGRSRRGRRGVRQAGSVASTRRSGTPLRRLHGPLQLADHHLLHLLQLHLRRLRLPAALPAGRPRPGPFAGGPHPNGRREPPNPPCGRRPSLPCLLVCDSLKTSPPPPPPPPQAPPACPGGAQTGGRPPGRPFETLRRIHSYVRISKIRPFRLVVQDTRCEKECGAFFCAAKRGARGLGTDAGLVDFEREPRAGAPRALRRHLETRVRLP